MFEILFLIKILLIMNEMKFIILNYFSVMLIDVNFLFIFIICYNFFNVFLIMSCKINNKDGYL